MSSELHLETQNHRTAFEPGETVQGIASWAFDEPPDAVEIRLFYYTQGKGQTDVRLAERLSFDRPGPRGAKGFSFVLPPGPYSYSGTILSVLWGIELVILPQNDAQRLELTCRPSH